MGSFHTKNRDDVKLAPASIADLAFFLLYINDIPDISIYADDITLYIKCDLNGASDLWQTLELASKLESDH